MALENGVVPRIPLDLRGHKVAIAIPWVVIFLGSCGLPLIAYFTLHFMTQTANEVVFSIAFSLLGASSLLSFVIRTWRLLRPSSDCRPIGSPNPWCLDYFGWSFVIISLIITSVISCGIAFDNMRLVSIPLAILIFYVSIQLLSCQAMIAWGIKAPFRISSIARGEPVRAGCLCIVEDVVAVDAGQGANLRRLLHARYDASPILRTHFARMDVLWGSTGLIIVAIIGICVSIVPDLNISYAIGWGIPWVWAVIMAAITLQMTQRALRTEELLLGGEKILN